MATGASAAKRKAKKAAADQYYKAFSELKSANADYKAATNNKKKIVDVLGEDVSYSSKRLAMKADKAGRAMNGNAEYREDLRRYNSRYEGLKKQLSGQAVERYKIGLEPNVEVDSRQLLNNGFLGIGNTNRTGPMIGQQNNTGMAGMITGLNDESPESKGKAAAQNRYYNSEEEAMADAKLAMEKYNSSWDLRLGQKRDVDKSQNSGGMLSSGVYSQADINNSKINDPSKFIQKENLNGISVGYRQLGDMESAYGEIAALSEKAGKSPVNKQADEYAKVAQQLREKLKREQGNANNRPNGLLASELAGNNLNPEVIRA